MVELLPKVYDEIVALARALSAAKRKKWDELLAKVSSL
jgi:hypothetical protein